MFQLVIKQFRLAAVFFAVLFLFVLFFSAFVLAAEEPSEETESETPESESSSDEDSEEKTDDESAETADTDSEPEEPSDDVGESDEEAVTSDDEKKKKDNPLKRYAKWIKAQEKMALEELDLWGATATIPQGYMVLFGGWGTMRPHKRFDENRELIDMLPIFEVPDPFHDEGEFFSFDFRADGSLIGFTAGAMYGVTDTVSVGINTIFSKLDITMDPVFTPGSCERLGIATLEEFYKMLELLGRPRPKHSYSSDGVDWGDTTLSVLWNYFRGDWFSGGLTGNLFLPTAHMADPNQALIFALGPDIDSGTPAWGFGISKMFDFKLPAPADFITVSLTGEAAYYFQTRRKSPRFIEPNQDVWDYMMAQGVELDFLPDLSDMDSHYYYTPPPWVAGSISVGAGPFSLAYRHGWGFEADYQSNSPGFRKMLDEIGLVGTGDDGKIIFAASVPLTPIYLPAIVQFRMEYVTDGRNNLVFRDIYQAGIGIFIPINPPDKYKPNLGDDK